MRRADSGRTVLVVAVVLIAALSGCAGWGVDGPAEGAVEEGEDEPEGSDGGSEGDGDDVGDRTDGAVTDEPPDADDGDDVSEESTDEASDETDGSDADTDGETDPDADADEDAESTDADDDDGGAEADADGADDGDGLDDEEATDGEDAEGADGAGDDEETDEPSREYDAEAFTFVEIAYGDEEERPPNSVGLLNGHDRPIDLSGWAVTTTEGGEHVFAEDTAIESDETRTVGFESGELTRDGGTLALIDAHGRVVIEDEYDD